jgi:hypothetical protein
MQTTEEASATHESKIITRTKSGSSICTEEEDKEDVSPANLRKIIESLKEQIAVFDEEKEALEKCVCV